MGYEEKFLYCKEGKDTRLLLKMLKEKPHNDFKVLEVLTLKRNWNVRYRNAEGINVNGKIIPFTFISRNEIENPDMYYRKPLGRLNDNDIATMKNGNTSLAFGEIQEHFFNKNDLLIWIAGDRGNIRNGYDLFGYAHAVENTLFNTMYDDDFPKQFLVDGKLDIENALPYACELAVDSFVSKGMLTKEEAQVIKEVRMISLDGIPDIDNLLKQTDLFRRKTYTK
ncbi:MAG: hypothetical protein IJA10_12610 [Lachnospiraceae bacterium]|nr:hypothetical protein [Lachnospiraceae bacterium]